MLSNFEIEDIVKELKIPDFRACICKDELKNNKVMNGSYIINMQNNRDGHGTHWVALFIDKQMHPWYFDSFGFICPQEVIAFCKRTRNKIGYSNKEIQDIKSQSCGYYCIAFIQAMSKQMSYYEKSPEMRFNEFLNHFNFDPKKNELILHKLLP